ncbi:uncharacterized protein LOC135924093 [Gordionus sp. m RMFG-2023]|uniref:uncharacterized protein LOC135924093 n=1 Tax=Gordionus sp. m RMFG-2023 TaxID=3053472 RepID=UPI0031FC81EA
MISSPLSSPKANPPINCNNILPASSSLGVPAIAKISKFTAPVHIDVGGIQYTTTLQTLTKYPESIIAKLFNGTIPIVLDSFKQHYFLNRDGKIFRHILNFLRNGRLLLSSNFKEIDLLMEEAQFFEINPLIKALEMYKKIPTNEHNYPYKNMADENDQLLKDACESRVSSPKCNYNNNQDYRAKRKGLIVDNLLAKKMAVGFKPNGDSCQMPKIHVNSCKDISNNLPYLIECLILHIDHEVSDEPKVYASCKTSIMLELFPEIFHDPDSALKETDVLNNTEISSKIKWIEIWQRILSSAYNFEIITSTNIRSDSKNGHLTEYILFSRISNV